VDQGVLLKILSFRVKDSATFNLLKEIITSYTAIPGQKVGMPIGNLASQIFANIYLNELDRFIVHRLKTKNYLRYGDDFIVIEPDMGRLELFKNQIIRFLNNELKLTVNPKSDKIIKVRHGLKLLGIKFWPSGRTLTKRNLLRLEKRLNINNISSYSGLIKQHGNYKQIKRFDWLLYEKFLADL